MTLFRFSCARADITDGLIYDEADRIPRAAGNEELVTILYRVYMNREADPEGLTTWTQKLDEGTGLNDLLNVFAKTGEFKAVLKNMAE